MADLDDLDTILRNAGLQVREQSGWKSRGHGSFPGPVRAVMLHHTAGKAPGDLDVVTYGRSDLPGPLCNLYLDPDGVFITVAAGRAYHAGSGGPWHNVDRDEGNSTTIGIEVSALGDEPIKGRQYDAMVAGTRALTEHYGLKPSTGVVLHKEYSDTGKVDLRNNGDTVRDDVAHYPTPGDLEGVDMFVLKTKGGKGKHYVIDAGHATYLEPGYTLQGAVPTIVVLAANDDGSGFTK